MNEEGGVDAEKVRAITTHRQPYLVRERICHDALDVGLSCAFRDRMIRISPDFSHTKVKSCIDREVLFLSSWPQTWYVLATWPLIWRRAGQIEIRLLPYLQEKSLDELINERSKAPAKRVGIKVGSTKAAASKAGKGGSGGVGKASRAPIKLGVQGKQIKKPQAQQQGRRATRAFPQVCALCQIQYILTSIDPRVNQRPAHRTPCAMQVAM